MAASSAAAVAAGSLGSISGLGSAYPRNAQVRKVSGDEFMSIIQRQQAANATGCALTSEELRMQELLIEQELRLARVTTTAGFPDLLHGLEEERAKEPEPPQKKIPAKQAPRIGLAPRKLILD